MSEQSIAVVVSLNSGLMPVRTETYRIKVNDSETAGVKFHELATVIMDWVMKDAAIKHAKGE